MATKKVVKKSAGSSKASKKKSAKTDPPIVVGGGGSTFVWLPARSPLQVPTPPPPNGLNAALYDCYEVAYDVDDVDVFDGGISPLHHHHHPLSKLHFTQFKPK